MVLFVIISLDRPFQGAMAIPADSYQLVHDQLMKEPNSLSAADRSTDPSNLRRGRE